VSVEEKKKNWQIVLIFKKMSGWIDKAVLDKPPGCRWPRKRSDALALKEGDSIELVGDWRHWCDSKRARCHLLCSAELAESQCSVDFRIRTELGQQLLCRFQTLEDGTCDSFVVERELCESESEASEFRSTHELAEAFGSSDDFIALSLKTSVELIRCKVNDNLRLTRQGEAHCDENEGSCAAPGGYRADFIEYAWVIPCDLERFAGPERHVLFRSVLVQPAAGNHVWWRRARVPDDVCAVNQLLPDELKQELRAARSVRDRGSRSEVLLVAVIKSGLPSLRDLCREALLCAGAGTVLRAALAKLSARGDGAVLQHLNFHIATSHLNHVVLESLRGPRSLVRSSGSLPVEEACVCIAETSRTSCGLSQCWRTQFDDAAITLQPNAAFELRCQCHAQSLDVDADSIVSVQWLRLDAPPLRKMDDGYFGLHPDSCALIYTGTWRTGAQTIDVWAPQ
jgi:hypothetical protein